MGMLLGSGSDRAAWFLIAGTKRALGNAEIVLDTLKRGILDKGQDII